jgi:hypothetical protein
MKTGIYVLLCAAVLLLLYPSNIYGQSTVTVNADQTVSINGSKFFPISVYVQSDYAGIKNMGVNVASRPFCVNIDAFNQIVSNQLYCHYTAGPGCDYDNATAIKNRDASGFTQSISQVKNSNYLFGYGLPDEPKSATGLSAADTEWAYGVIKAADPNHPVFLTDYASDISAYKNSADIFLNDQYPFNNNTNPLYDIKDKVKAMQSQVAPKPVWLIIQTGSQFGMPTNAQIRAETYLSIALGSTGIIFYSYDVQDAGGVHNIKTDGDPVFMKNLITELKSFSPYFLGAKNNNLTYTSNDIDAILRNYNGKSYLIAVNKSATAKNITFTLSGFSNATATIVGLSSAGSTRTGQTRTISAGSLSDTFQGLEAVVYEISASCVVPNQPGPITGNTNVTAGSSQTYSIPAVSGATSYTWTLPTGWSGTSTSTSITTTAGSTGGTITVKANNACGAGTARSLTVTVGTTSSNLALNKTATTSSVEAAGLEGSKAVDGNGTSRWASAYTDAEWIYVDLNATYNVNRVKITWEAAYGKNYKIQIASSTAGPWSDLKTITGNTALVNDHTGLSGSGRYIRILGSLRGTAWGYSIYELEVYGTSGCTLPAQPGTITGNTSVTAGSNNTYSIASVSGATSYTWTLPSGWSGSSTTTSITTTAGSAGGTISVKANNACGASAARTLTVTVGSSTSNLALNRPTTTSSIEGAGFEGSKAVDGNATTRWASIEDVDPQWIRIDLGSSYNINRVKIVWEAAYATAYQVQVSADGSAWTTIKSVSGNTTLTNDWTSLTGTGRYVRINGTTRGTSFGYSIFEVEVYGVAVSGAGGLTAEESVSSVEEEVSIHPNPVEDQLFISSPGKVRSVNIYDLQGQRMLSIENPGHAISVRSLTKGLHIAVVETQRGKIRKIRFVKK